MNENTVPVSEYIAVLKQQIELLSKIVDMQRKNLDLLEQAVQYNEATIANMERQLGEWLEPGDRATRRLWLIEHFMGGL